MIRSIERLASRALRLPLASAVLAAGIALAAAPTASAQFGGRSGMATLFIPDYLPRDLPVFVDALSLEEWQRPILEALLEDYNTSFQTASEGVRANMGQLREPAAGASADKVVEMISAPLEAWAREKAKLRSDFLESVRSQLSDVQAEQWPRLERALRREKSLPNGEISAESLNLILLMRELNVPPAAADAAREVTEAYEVRLDEALAARDAILESSISELLKAMSSNESERGVAIQERIMQRRIAVRDAQEAGIRDIAAALGAEYGPRFERRALERGFPQVFRPDPINPMIDAALALPDLSETQKAAIEKLDSEFNAEFSGLQTRLVDAFRNTEPREPRRRTELAMQKAAGGNVRFSEAPEIETLKTEREAIYTRYRNELSAILNPTQLEAIPGFGKPGAELPPGQTYQGAVREGRAATPIGAGKAGGGDGVGPDGIQPTVDKEIPQPKTADRDPSAPGSGFGSDKDSAKGGKGGKGGGAQPQ